MLRLIRILMFMLPLSTAPVAFATTFASGGAGTSTTTTHSGSRIDGFVIVEDVAYDASAGRWQKELMNVGSGSGNSLASGVPAAIDETFINVGSQAWSSWHERVISRTTIV